MDAEVRGVLCVRTVLLMYNSVLPPINSPANKTNELNGRAEGGRNFKVFFPTWAHYGIIVADDS